MSTILKAVLSHYVAINDKLMAELDICLNHKQNVDDAIHLFSRLSENERIIDTVKRNIDYNNKKSVAGAMDLMKKIESIIPIAPPSQIIKEGETPA